MTLNSKPDPVGVLTRCWHGKPTGRRRAVEYCRSVIRRGRANRSCLFLSTRRVCSREQEIQRRSNPASCGDVSRMSAGHLSTQHTLPPRSTATFNPSAVDLFRARSRDRRRCDGETGEAYRAEQSQARGRLRRGMLLPDSCRRKARMQRSRSRQRHLPLASVWSTCRRGCFYSA